LLLTQGSSAGDKVMKGQLEQYGETTSYVIRINRVHKIIKGGLTMRYNAMVVCGNMRGTAGFGVGKGKVARHAVNLAFLKAQRNILHVSCRDGRTLYHDVQGKHAASKVDLRAAKPGSGLVCSDVVRGVLESVGISDCIAKCHGSRNKFNVIQATFNALTHHRSVEDIAFMRGRRLIDLSKQI
jgi:small subunit ribosomal protein S5